MMRTYFLPQNWRRFMVCLHHTQPNAEQQQLLAEQWADVWCEGRYSQTSWVAGSASKSTVRIGLLDIKHMRPTRCADFSLNNKTQPQRKTNNNTTGRSCRLPTNTTCGESVKKNAFRKMQLELTNTHKCSYIGCERLCESCTWRFQKDLACGNGWWMWSSYSKRCLALFSIEELKMILRFIANPNMIHRFAKRNNKISYVLKINSK